MATTGMIIEIDGMTGEVRLEAGSTGMNAVHLKVVTQTQTGRSTTVAVRPPADAK